MYYPCQIVFSFASNSPFKIGDHLLAEGSHPEGKSSHFEEPESGVIVLPSSIEEAEESLRNGTICVPVSSYRSDFCVCCGSWKHEPRETCDGSVQRAIDMYNAVIEKYGPQSVKYKKRLADHLASLAAQVPAKVVCA